MGSISFSASAHMRATLPVSKDSKHVKLQKRMNKATLSRKELLISAAALGLALSMPKAALAQGAATPRSEITIDDLKVAQKLAGLDFSDDELKEILQDVKDWLTGYETIRKEPITYLVEPPTVFEPLSLRPLAGKRGVSVKVAASKVSHRPVSEDDLAFMPLRDIAHLVKTRAITSSDLTEMYLGRLGRYGDKLLAVITLLPEQARADAKKADEEIATGRYRGPLHGVPTGVKDLFALRGAPTTWGAAPYQDQVFDYDATLVQKLRQAGAVICAKTSMGALAEGDVWFKGMTKNPWNPKEGSSGSSAGSAACVSAGLLPFAIGTETLGSIVSPSNQCRVTGLRPSYGRISRHGAMAVSWTMDKVGIISRCAEDAALVFAAVSGADPLDRSSVDRPFHYSPKVDFAALKIAFLLDLKEDPAKTTKPQTTEALALLQKLGATVHPLSITPAEAGVLTILDVESAAAFDDLTRSDRIHLLKNSSWPETYRAGRFVPGVELLQAYRARTLLMKQFEDELGDFDILVADRVGGHTLAITNLTGHPQVLLPWGVTASGRSRSVSLIGRLYEEDKILSVANALQGATNYHTLRPDLSKV